MAKSALATKAIPAETMGTDKPYAFVSLVSIDFSTGNALVDPVKTAPNAVFLRKFRLELDEEFMLLA
jgi:hypothetical protein